MEPESKPSYTAAFQAVASPKDMVNLAYADGYLNSIHTQTQNYGTVMTEKKERAQDEFGHMAGVMMQRYQDISQDTVRALADLENSLEEYRRHIARYENELADQTIMLSDNSAVYFNAETGLFEEQQEDGSWQVLGQQQQQEAFAIADENGGLAATRQAKEFADTLNERQAGFALSLGEMEENLEEIDASVENGTLSAEEGAALKEDILQKTDTMQAEIDREIIFMEEDAVPAYVEVERPLGGDQSLESGGAEPSAAVTKSTVSAFADPDYQSALSDCFQCAAQGEEVPQGQEQTPDLTTEPVQSKPALPVSGP